MGSLYLAAFVLAVVGGAIAYGGDRLGTYVGKKRISFRWRRISLRPRHTATLYTTLSGSIISVLTLVLIISLDSRFKRALLEGPQLLADNYQYRHQIKLEKTNTLKYHNQAQQATVELAQAKSQLQPARQQLTSAQGALRSSRQSLLQRQRQLSAAQSRLMSAQVSLSATDQGLRLARTEVQQAKQSLTTAEARVATAQQRAAHQQQRVAALTAVGTHLKTANELLQRTNHDLKRTNADLKRERASLEARTASSQRLLIFRKDQELGRVVIKAAQPVSLIEYNLAAFLNGLGRTAEGLGAKVGVNNRAVVVAAPASPDSIEYSPLTLTDEGKAVQTIAQQIAAQSDNIPSVVIVARAVTNSFQGEQTSVQLQPYENFRIFRKGDAIATATVSGAQTLQIIDALRAFLVDTVRPAVLGQHFIPQKDPETGKLLIGSVLDEATSQSLALQIERLGGTARVTAYASEDTYSGGPLHLRFGTSPAGPPVAAPPAVAVGGRS